MGVVALLQLALGKGHWINHIHPALLPTDRMGTADYSAGPLAFDWLFRPTSIFLHTGKFGIAAFLLASYRLFYRTWRWPGLKVWLPLTALEFLLLLVTGQRAAITLYLLALPLIAFLLAMRTGHFQIALTSVWLFVTVISAVFLLTMIHDPLAQVISGRLLSVVPEAAVRLRDNLLLPLTFVADRWLFAGEGAGAFSLGSTAFGGRPLYEVVPVGTAENAWLRLIAEQGMPGAVLFLILLGLVATWALRRSRVFAASRDAAARGAAGACIWLLYALAAVSAWANTHDVFGNSLATFFLFTTAGVAANATPISLCARCYPKHAKHDDSGQRGFAPRQSFGSRLSNRVR